MKSWLPRNALPNLFRTRETNTAPLGNGLSHDGFCWSQRKQEETQTETQTNADAPVQKRKLILVGEKK